MRFIRAQSTAHIARDGFTVEAGTKVKQHLQFVSIWFDATAQSTVGEHFAFLKYKVLHTEIKCRKKNMQTFCIPSSPQNKKKKKCKMETGVHPALL